MPEYHLPIETGNAWRNYADLDPFTRGYIEAMFFTDASCADDGDLEGATFDELAPSSLARIIADCKAFQEANEALLDAAIEHGGRKGEYDEEAAGRDYWYTRNGHGVGFWDRGLGDIGDKLSDACGRREFYVCRGDDGLVHVEG